MIDTAATLQDSRIATTPNRALTKASRLYREAGLRSPPVPPELADRVQEQAEWQFSTDLVELTDRTGFMAAVRDPATPAQIGFGHVGHGITSWWLCYRLIRDSLAVFLRHSYGGVYSDNEASGSFFNSIIERIEELIVLADAARGDGRIVPGRRLLLAIDSLGGSGWEIAGEADGWHDSNQPLDDVMAFLVGE